MHNKPKPSNMMMRKPKTPMKTIKRLFSYISGKHKVYFGIVFVCIVLNTLASVAGSLFLKTLIDDYITPLMNTPNPVFTGLLQAILIMGGIYLMGVIASLVYNRLMVSISQGAIKKIRDEMFSKMQKLPVRYFDTHQFGDVMSHYTNDTDALRQMLSQSIPQLLSSVFTIVGVLAAMIITSVPLTLIVIVMVVIMIVTTMKIGMKSAKFFIQLQKSLGATNGYIEEMINGQKVVKVFTHEDEVKKNFDKYNHGPILLICLSLQI